MPKNTNKYGRKSPCDGCINIALSTDKEPCVSCRMVEYPSNYTAKKITMFALKSGKPT